jgi:hypothetical protein
MRTSRATRQATTDRVPGDRHPETLFDGGMHFGRRQGTIRGGQGADRGPLDYSVAEPLGLEDCRSRLPLAHAGSLGNPVQNGPQGSIMV